MSTMDIINSTYTLINWVDEYDRLKKDFAKDDLSEEELGALYSDAESFSTFPNPYKLDIKVKYHVDGLEKIAPIPIGDWVDLRAAEDVTIQANNFAMISLGVSMKLPDGYEAHVVPRSSTFKKWGIVQTNSMGIIDNSYCGENDIWMMPVYALRNTTIHKNDRICQFRIVPVMNNVTFTEVEHMEDPDRGGFGSTGTN